MTAPFECEVRFFISDVDEFRRRIIALGGRARFEYAFTDHYFRPGGGVWNPRTQALRIREHHRPPQPSEVLLTWVDVVQVDGFAFKRSRFAEGKVRLYSGTVDACRAVANGLGYEPWLDIHKPSAVFYDIPGVGELVAEQVEGIGWMGEVEVNGERPDAAARTIQSKLEALDISADAVIPDPLAAVMASRLPRNGRAVYFCGSIRGGRALQPLYALIVAFLQQRGYEVLTTHVAAPDVLTQERRQGGGPAEIYTRDVRWLTQCDLVIAEVSTPSLGVGVEIATAQRLGKPIVCLCREDVALSAMVEGNPGVRVFHYRGESEVLSLLDRELRTQESWRSHQARPV